jgi:heptosyltransferase-2
MPVVAVGGEADSDRLNDLRRAFGHQLAIIDSVPLATLAAAMTHARLFIGHDSGVSHLAAAVGTRCLLLFGPTDPAVWAPANTGVEVLAAPDGNLDKITADSVLAAVLPIVPTHGSTT